MSEAQRIGYTQAQSAGISYATPVSMYVNILRYKSCSYNHHTNARVSRNLPERIMRFFKDHFTWHEVTGKYTHCLQSYNNHVMSEIKDVSLQLQCINTMRHG